MKHIYAVVCCITYLASGVVCTPSLAQHSAAPSPLSLAVFMRAIDRQTDGQGRGSEVQMAEAEIGLAKMVPSPTLVMGNLSGDISGINMPHQLFVGMEYVLETGGKRQQRIRHAQAHAAHMRIDHEMHIRQRKRDALLLFYHCWVESQEVAALEEYEKHLRALVPTDSLTAIKRRVALGKTNLEIAKARDKFGASLQEINTMIGNNNNIIPVEPTWADTMALPSLPDNNLAVRAEQLSATVAREALALESSNRRGDITVMLGNSFITRATNPEAPSPSYNAITASLAIPLRFTSRKAATTLDKLRLQAALDQQTFQTQNLDAAWRSLQERQLKLIHERYALNKLISTQQDLVALAHQYSAAEVLAAATTLFDLRKMRQQADLSLAEVNADLFWHTGMLPETEELQARESD